jgi:hypothetical protein
VAPLCVAVHTTAPFALTNAVVPDMMRQGWGRIINVTTSLGTMLNAGNPTYGPSKAAMIRGMAVLGRLPICGRMLLSSPAGINHNPQHPSSKRIGRCPKTRN